jgi:carboxyl-terminal processing protease
MTSREQNTGHLLRNFTLTLLGLVLVCLVFLSGVVVGQRLTAAGLLSNTPTLSTIPTLDTGDSGPTDADFRVFWEVWNTVEDRFYYDLPDSQTRMYGAINGMLDTLNDPYTAFITPEAARILREDFSGSFEGIGAYVEQAPEGGVYIIRAFEDGPAEQAGIRAGDIIIAADGVDLTGMTLNEALLHVRGPAGTPVVLTIVREGEAEPLEITVVRARLDVPTIESRMLEGNIGYVALFEFNATANTRLRNAVQELIDQGAQSVILDLRDNPGGYLEQSVDVADLFLNEGLVLIQRDVDGNVREYRSHTGDFAEDIPLVVLINSNSASASEIVAGAIRDRERGVLIGETSFGKGSVQLLYELSDGSELRITYANWYTPDNVSISGEGITPDIVVETPTEPSTTDPQLERAIQYLLTGQ